MTSTITVYSHPVAPNDAVEVTMSSPGQAPTRTMVPMDGTGTFHVFGAVTASIREVDSKAQINKKNEDARQHAEAQLQQVEAQKDETDSKKDEVDSKKDDKKPLFGR